MLLILILLYYQATKLPSYQATKLPSYQATKLPSYTSFLFCRFIVYITYANSFIMKLFTPYLTYKAKNGKVQVASRKVLVSFKKVLVLFKHQQVFTRSVGLFSKQVDVLFRKVLVLSKHLQVFTKTILFFTKHIHVLSKKVLVLSKHLHFQTKQVQIRFSGLYQNLMYLHSNILLSQINSRASIKRFFQKHIKCKLNIQVFSF